MRKIVLIGGNGQLGTDLARAGRQPNVVLTSLTHLDIEICDTASIEKVLSGFEPEVVVNTAACHGAKQYTSADQEAFFRVNGIGAMNLARFCRRHGALLIHFSTDYVFGRERTRKQPYVEEDPPCPVNTYGASKLAGEYLVRAFCPKHYVIRIASVYGSAGCRARGNSNFVKMVLSKVRNGESLKVVNDQFMSPTWTRAVAIKTFELINARASFGLYHMAGSGGCSWYEFACAIIQMAGLPARVQPVATQEEDADEIFLRPRWTALDNANLRRSGLPDLPDWRELLEEYIRTEEKTVH